MFDSFGERQVNDRLLLPIEPTGDEKEKESERGRQPIHGGRVPEVTAWFKCRRKIVDRQMGRGLRGRSLLLRH